ncbi:MAG: PEGA domain-containing protein [Lentisphaeria bacterium]|nr:PEGA domain-containing protein [Lentisphaeria bacterium]
MSNRFITLLSVFLATTLLIAETTVTLPATPNITVVPTPLEGAGTQTITVEVKNTPAPQPKPQLKVALIVQNHVVQQEYQQYLQALADMLTGALSNRGMAVINPANALGTTQNTTPNGEVMPAAAATGLTGMLGADYFITASLRRITKKTVGLKPETSFTSLTLGMNLTIATGQDAVAFASQDVVLESPPQSAQMLANNLEDIFHNLLEDSADKGAEWLMEKIASRQTIPAGATQMVSIAFSCNIPGAFLEIDGIAVGTVSSPVTLNIPAGLHNMRVSYPFFVPYELQAIFREGSKFDINLELSQEGFTRWQNREAFLTTQERILESGATDDYVRRVLADANAEFLKNSHFRWDGALQTLTVTREGQPPVVYGPTTNILQK